MHPLHRFGLIFSVILLLSENISAQERTPLYDLQKIHFGFAIIGNNARLKYSTSADYLNMDTIRGVEGISFPGFGVGGIMNIRVAEYWDMRTQLNITFAQRNLNYTFKNGDEKLVKIESTYLEVPVVMKYKSKRHRNTRFYAISGLTYRYDFASDIDTERSNTKAIVAIKPNTFSYDIGCGLDFYFEYFKFSPEVKVSNGLTNALVKDPYFYSSALHQVRPNMVQFSLLFE